mgnify:CR=1 FL=1
MGLVNDVKQFGNNRRTHAPYLGFPPKGSKLNPLPNGLNLNLYQRSDRTMLDEFGNNATIIPPFCLKDSGYALGISDNQALDIYQNDFTAFGWFNLAAGDMIFGKLSSNINGQWAIRVDAGSKLLFYIVTSTGLNKTISTFVINLNELYFICVDINQTTKKARIFVNGNQIGSLDYEHIKKWCRLI